MIEMTLSSRHRIRNSSPGGLRPSTLPLGHGGSGLAPGVLSKETDGRVRMDSPLVSSAKKLMAGLESARNKSARLTLIY